MAVSTFSRFYYGYEITVDNRFINFNEGAGELTASVAIGSYTLTEILVAVKTAMDAAGTDTYTISVDRATRIITISSTGTFSLLLATGSGIGQGTFGLLGFDGASDTSTASSHIGTAASGFEFRNQFVIQDFVSDDDFQEKIDSSVNESANGVLEVVNFGTRKFTEFSLKFITNKPGDGQIIRHNSTGVEDARAFLQEITKKNPIEFMIDESNTTSFKKLVLEKTPTSSQGTSYKLNELVRQNAPGYYEINNLKFRVF